MTTQKIKQPRNAVERNLALTGEVTHYLLNHPEVFDLKQARFIMRTIRNNGSNHGDKKLERYSFSATVWAEGKNYVSKCPELGVVSYGRSPERALSRLEEAIELYLENARLLGLMPNLAPMLKSKHRFTTIMEVTA